MSFGAVAASYFAAAPDTHTHISIIASFDEPYWASGGIAIPSGVIASGDVAIVGSGTYRADTNPVIPTPPDATWTPVLGSARSDNVGPSHGVQFWTKVLDGGESGSWVFDHGDTTWSSGVILRGVDTSHILDVAASTNAWYGGTVSVPSITTVTGGTMLLLFETAQSDNVLAVKHGYTDLINNASGMYVGNQEITTTGTVSGFSFSNGGTNGSDFYFVAAIAIRRM